MEKIDFDFILDLIEEIRQEYKQDEIKVFPAGYNKSFLYRIYTLFPRKIKENFLIPLYLYKKQKTSTYYNSIGYTRLMALDFLYYIIKNKPEFDLNGFNEKDKKTILKFIKNIISLAILDKVKKSRLFEDEDLLNIKQYNSLEKNIIKKGNNYELNYNNKKYLLPIQNIEIPLFYHAYNLDELPKKVIEKIEKKDFIDAGAYIGDSGLVLNNYSPKNIYAFEPIPENYEKLLKTISLNKQDRIIPIKKGLGEKTAKLKLVSKDIISFVDEAGTEETDIIRIDDFVKSNNLNIGLIKLDVEGYEFEVLKGAKNTIKKFHPVLLISVYHRGKDFFEIPEFLKNLGKYKFRFFNLNYEYPANDKMLIAYIE